MTSAELPVVTQTSPFDAIRHLDADGNEYWYGRELMHLMEYASWAKFALVVAKAKNSLGLVKGAEAAEHHLSGWASDGGRWENTKVEDFRLTRFGAYLTAMAGDDTKQAVAEGRIYFAVQTRKAELAEAAPKPAAEMDEVEFAEHHLRIVREKRALEIQNAEAKAVIAELEPKAEQADHYRKANGITAIGDFANDLAMWAQETHGVVIKQVDVRDYLGELKLLIRGNTIRNNEPTADAQKRGLMRIKHNTYGTNTRGVQSSASARLTQAGVAYVWDRATQRIAANGSLKPSTAVERTNP